MFHARVVYSGRESTFPMYVVPTATCNLLGRVPAQDFELIRRPDASVYETDIIPPDVFGDSGQMDCEPVKLRLKPDAVPYSVHAARRVPMPMMDRVQAIEIEE